MKTLNIIALLNLILLLATGCGVPSGGSNTPAEVAPIPKNAPFNGKLIFVTAGTYPGYMGGIAGADDICASAAEASGLDGEFKALLSSSSVNAIDRMTDSGPYYLVDGKTRVFNSLDGFKSAPINPIRMDENGNILPEGDYYTKVWSGSYSGGMRDTNGTCEDWTANSSNWARIGQASLIRESWIGASAQPCGWLAHIYCVEQ